MSQKKDINHRINGSTIKLEHNELHLLKLKFKTTKMEQSIGIFIERDDDP